MGHETAEAKLKSVIGVFGGYNPDWFFGDRDPRYSRFKVNDVPVYEALITQGIFDFPTFLRLNDADIQELYWFPRY